MNERDREFFQPVWRRVLVVTLLSVWTAVEWWTGNGFWGILTTGALGVSIWMFTVNYRRPKTGEQGN